MPTTPTEQSTWKTSAEDGGATRPTKADLGIGIVEQNGIEKVIVSPEGETVPLDGTYVQPDALNQDAFQALAAGRQIASAKVTVSWTGITPILTVECANEEITSASFTAVRLSAGHFTLMWLSTLLPPIVTLPMTTVNASSTGTALAGAAAAIPRRDPAPPANYTRLLIDQFVGAVATDLTFTLHI